MMTRFVNVLGFSSEFYVYKLSGKYRETNIIHDVVCMSKRAKRQNQQQQQQQEHHPS